MAKTALQVSLEGFDGIIKADHQGRSSMQILLSSGSQKALQRLIHGKSSCGQMCSFVHLIADLHMMTQEQTGVKDCKYEHSKQVHKLLHIHHAP